MKVFKIYRTIIFGLAWLRVDRRTGGYVFRVSKDFAAIDVILS